MGESNSRPLLGPPTAKQFGGSAPMALNAFGRRSCAGYENRTRAYCLGSSRPTTKLIPHYYFLSTPAVLSSNLLFKYPLPNPVFNCSSLFRAPFLLKHAS